MDCFQGGPRTLLSWVNINAFDDGDDDDGDCCCGDSSQLGFLNQASFKHVQLRFWKIVILSHGRHKVFLWGPRLKLCSMPTFNPFWNTLSMLLRFMKYFTKYPTPKREIESTLFSDHHPPIPCKSEIFCSGRKELIYNGELFFLLGGNHRCGALMARLKGHPSPLDLKTTEPRLMVIVKTPEEITTKKRFEDVKLWIEER